MVDNLCTLVCDRATNRVETGLDVIAHLVVATVFARVAVCKCFKQKVKVDNLGKETAYEV